MLAHDFCSIVFSASLSIPGTLDTKGHSRPGSRSTLAATLLTQTRGALIAVIISVVLLFIDRKKIIVTLLVGIGYHHHDYTQLYRTSVLKTSLRQ